MTVKKEGSEKWKAKNGVREEERRARDKEKRKKRKGGKKTTARQRREGPPLSITNKNHTRTNLDHATTLHASHPAHAPPNE